MDTQTQSPTDQAGGWDAAAQPSTPDATPAQAPPQSATGTAQPGAAPQATATPSTDSQAQIASTPAPDYTAPPRILTPVRPGIMGVVDKIVNALAGTNRPELAKDQEGNTYVRNATLSRSEQWQRIGGEALVGAAKGFAAGRGAGNMGAAAAAGVDAGAQMGQQQQAQRQQMTQDARQQTLDNANNQMLRMKMAEQAMTMAAMKTKGTEDQIKFADEQTDRLVKEGGTVLGTMSRPDELRNILKVNPDIMQDMIQKHQIEIMPHYNPDGSAGGFKVIKMPDGYRTNVLPAGATFHTFDETTGQYVAHKTSSPITQGEIDDYEHSAGAAALEFSNKKAIQAHTAAQTAAENATVSKTPSEIAKNNAEAAKDRQEALNAAQPQPGAGAEQGDIAEGLASGRYQMGKDVPLRTVKGQPTAAQQAAAADAYSKAHFGLPYSPEIIRQEARFAEQPKTQAYLDGIDRMLGVPGQQGQFDQLLDLAKKAGVPEKYPAGAATQWIKRTLGDSAAKSFHQLLSETQSGLGTLIGNPLLGSGESDLKLKTAQDQFGGNPTLENLKSAVDTASDVLVRSKKTMASNNRYIQQRYGQSLSPNTIQPGEPTATFPDGTTRVVRNGQWVPTQPR